MKGIRDARSPVDNIVHNMFVHFRLYKHCKVVEWGEHVWLEHISSGFHIMTVVVDDGGSMRRKFLPIHRHTLLFAQRMEISERMENGESVLNDV